MLVQFGLKDCSPLVIDITFSGGSVIIVNLSVISQTSAHTYHLLAGQI